VINNQNNMMGQASKYVNKVMNQIVQHGSGERWLQVKVGVKIL